MTTQACGCDEAKEWKARALRAELALKFARRHIERILHSIDRVLDSPGDDPSEERIPGTVGETVLASGSFTPERSDAAIFIAGIKAARDSSRPGLLGKRVRSAATLRQRDFTEVQRSWRKTSSPGNIIDRSDAHGLCYEVRHDDGSRAWYDADELFDENGVAISELREMRGPEGVIGFAGGTAEERRAAIDAAAVKEEG